ncbi:putative membrane efflux protein [Mycolicibacterium chitae]|uniref:Putative membrane efflux protein n=1 Tax=Mycolicibacterium chitae TaxID=1792 RepID=A0A448I2S2_MYCCI|nr:MFS transporter [Mycolicibacterium chitae]MCV7104800.1 MFS transporter [Mycolicibacterium chitae]BBZ03337.1 putative membrane efflux protein [Mycolicibacterium chitae]VEG46778.1 putative membrane efflux protein [Mycolicibacterium chitae]
MTAVAARVGLLGVSHAATDFYQGSVAVLVPVLVLQAGFSAVAATTVVLAATLGSAVAQPVFGVLADRFQTFWLLPASMLLAAAGIGVLGLTTSYNWTLMAAGASGLGVAAYHPIAAMLARQVGGGTARSMSWFIAGGNIGLALAPAIAAPILLAFGPRASPLLAAPGILGGLAVIALRRWLLTGPGTPSATAPADVAENTDDWRSFGWLAAIAVLRSGAYFGISTVVGLLVVVELGRSQSAAAAALGVFLTVGVVATLAGGVIADRWRRVTCLRMGFAIIVPGLILLALAPNVPVAFAGAVVAGIGVFLPFSVQTTLGHEYLPQHIGTASGVTIGLSVSAGGAIAPLLGFIVESHGARHAMLALAVLPVLALVVSLRLREGHVGGAPPALVAHARAVAPPR